MRVTERSGRRTRTMLRSAARRCGSSDRWLRLTPRLADVKGTASRRPSAGPSDSHLTSAARSVYGPSMTGSRRCARHWRASPHPAEGPALRAHGRARTRRRRIDQERPCSRGPGPELKSEWSVKHRRGHKLTRQPAGCASKRSSARDRPLLADAPSPGARTRSKTKRWSLRRVWRGPPVVGTPAGAGHRWVVNGAGRGCQSGVRQDRPKAAAKRSP